MKGISHYALIISINCKNFFVKIRTKWKCSIKIIYYYVNQIFSSLFIYLTFTSSIIIISLTRSVLRICILLLLHSLLFSHCHSVDHNTIFPFHSVIIYVSLGIVLLIFYVIVAVSLDIVLLILYDDESK